MPNKDEKKARRAQILKLKLLEKDKLELELPISKEQFRDLFDWLDMKLAESNCDNGLTWTRQFLSDKNLPEDATIAWLATHGGFCDCEVLANTEDELSNII